MEPSAAKTPVLPQDAGSPAMRRPSLPYARAPDFSATHRTAGHRTSSPPAFFPPASARPWPIGAAARVFPWVWALRVSRPASPLAWAPGASAAAVVWLPAAPAPRPAVKRPPRVAAQVQVSAALVWAAASARVPRLPAHLVSHPAAAGSDWGGWLGS